MAEDINIETDADAVVNSLVPDQNYGGSTTLYVIRNSSAVITYMSFVHFPLGDIPAGSTINSAILYVYVNNANADYDACPAYNCAAAWVENLIIWNNKPATSGASIGNINMSSTGWKTLDITSVVQDWLDGVVNNYGIQVHPDVENKTASFFSKEVGAPYIPYLAINYTEGAGPIELSITDGIELGDSKSIVMTADISRIDGLKSGDIPNNIGMLNVLSGLKIGDSSSILSTLLKIDGIKLSDNTAISMIAEILKTDGIELSDSAIVSLFTAYLLSVTDGLKLSDTRTASMFSEITKTDSLILSDVITVAKILLLLDSLKMGDSASILPSIAIIDGLKIGDTSLITMLSQLLKTDGFLLDDRAVIGFAVIQFPRSLRRTIILIRDTK